MTYTGNPGTQRGPDGAVLEPGRQLELALLTADQAATIDEAAAAVRRSYVSAVAAGRRADADEYARLGDRLDQILQDNAARNRRVVAR